MSKKSDFRVAWETRTMTAEDFAANCDKILREAEKKLLRVIVMKDDKLHGTFESHRL